MASGDTHRQHLAAAEGGGQAVEVGVEGAMVPDIHGAPDIACVLDGDGRFLAISREFQRQLGWSLGALAVHAFDELFEPADLDSALRDSGDTHAAGFEDHLTKPINVEALDRAVAKLLAK